MLTLPMKEPVVSNLTQAQEDLYSFLCMDAYTTTSEDDMPEICDSIYNAILKQSDRQCIIELEQELTSMSEMESIEDEAMTIASNNRDTSDENEYEQSIIFHTGELLYAKYLSSLKD